MAEEKKDRVRAAKLRAKTNRTPEQDKWLREYEARVTMAAARKQAKNPLLTPSSYAPTRSPRPADSPEAARGRLDERARELGAPPVVRGPQLALGEPAPGPIVVHETERLDDALDPMQFTWIPKVPPAAPNAEPPPPGAPPPPAAGSPIIGDAPTAQPQGDPAAAQQFKVLVCFITRAGIAAALELSEDAPLPAELRALASSEAAQAELLEHVGGAAERVAMKYGFKSIPMADEAVVIGAVGGSALAIVAKEKRKRLKKPTEPKQVEKPEAKQAAMSDEIAHLFEEQTS